MRNFVFVGAIAGLCALGFPQDLLAQTADTAPDLSGPSLSTVAFGELHNLTLGTAIAGALPLLLIAGLGSLLIARRTWRNQTAPITQLAMGAPVSRRQITEVREAEAMLDELEGDAKSHRLTGTMIRVGRHEENDIQLTSQTVHRHHAVLHVTPRQTYVLTDLSGPEGNGVLVNGKRTEQTELTSGDLIELGDMKLRFRIGQAN